MPRLLFLPFFAILFFGCESDSKEVDPLFYQMSSADSTLSMNAIIDEILSEAVESQNNEEAIDFPIIAYCGVIDVFRININSRGDMMIDLKDDSTNVSEKTYKYFMFNINLTSNETATASMDVNYRGFDYPFYHRFKMKEILLKIDQTQEELDRVRNIEGVDSLLVEYYASKVIEWKILKTTLEVIGTPSLQQISYTAHVRLEYQKRSSKSEKVLNEIALAFYQMRNYECLRYFGETYLSLYDRTKRKNRKVDSEKLEALKVLHPASIYVYDSEKRRGEITLRPTVEID